MSARRTVKEIFWSLNDEGDRLDVWVTLPNGNEIHIADVEVPPGASGDDLGALAVRLVNDLGYEKTLPIIEDGHYNDGVIDYREIHCPCPESAFESLIVMVRYEGKAEVIDCTDNFFSEQTVLDAYDRLLDPDWGSEVNRMAMKAEFKRYLISRGAEFND